MKVLKYRLLREGERVKKGDEYRSGTNERGKRSRWQTVPNNCIGVIAPDPLFFASTQYRRLEQ
jgi:hypothetical protein